jgi:hypothetical protein
MCPRLVQYTALFKFNEDHRLEVDFKIGVKNHLFCGINDGVSSTFKFVLKDVIVALKIFFCYVHIHIVYIFFFVLTLQ